MEKYSNKKQRNFLVPLLFHDKPYRIHDIDKNILHSYIGSTESNFTLPNMNRSHFIAIKQYSSSNIK